MNEVPMLQVKNLHVTVDGKQILNGLDLTVNKGEVHAIMGPNGSGKSTLSYVMAGKPGCLAQMVEAYGKVGGNIVAALEVPDSETHKYGVIDPGATNGRLTAIRGMVEKPAAGSAPSNLMLPGRYILQPEVMRALDAQEKGAGGEIQLTDAMATLLAAGTPVHGVVYRGHRYDTGMPLGYLQAVVQLACQRSDLGSEFRQWLSEFVSGEGRAT